MHIHMSNTHFNAFKSMYNNIAHDITMCLSEHYEFDYNDAIRFLNSKNITFVQETKKTTTTTTTTTTKKSKQKNPTYPKLRFVPFCNVIYTDRCKSIRVNGGLFTQCTNEPMKDCEYCNTCNESSRFIGHIKTRLRTDPNDTVNDIIQVGTTKRRVMPLVNVLKKKTIAPSLDDIQHEIERLRSIYPGITIPDANFVERKGKGVQATTTESDSSSQNEKNTDDEYNDIEQLPMDELKVKILETFPNYTKITQAKVKTLRTIAKYIGLDISGVNGSTLKDNIREFIQEHNILPPPSKGRKSSSTSTPAQAPKETTTTMNINGHTYEKMETDKTKLIDTNTKLVYQIDTSNENLIDVKTPVGVWKNGTIIKLNHVLQNGTPFFIAVVDERYIAMDKNLKTLYNVNKDSEPHIDTDQVIGVYEKGEFNIETTTVKEEEAEAEDEEDAEVDFDQALEEITIMQDA